MTGRLKVMSIFGTRPEAIKLAPVVLALQAEPATDHVICVSGQHRQMLDQVLSVFGMVPDHDLNVMKSSQDLSHVTRSVLEGVSHVLRQERPDWLIVQGDTTTAFAAALAGFYEQVNVAHVEAGLRTHDRLSPWPEEINRRLVGTLANLHFAPTPGAAANLLREGVSEDDVLVTGNTVIDALRLTSARSDKDVALDAVLREHSDRRLWDPSRRLLLVTLHRRENLGETLRSICQGLARLAARGDVEIAFPVHLNPAVRSVVSEVLGAIPGVHLLPPLDYLPFVALLQRSFLVITDSGGIQEEAPGLGKPVIVARDTTERPEAVAAGTAVLAGPDGNAVEAACIRLLDDPSHYARMATAANPFGDGHAAERIVRRLLSHRPEHRRT
jgi:UDP-N-acetylglucosamine 2-epimerase (non-hydrolysing)